jgi:hypothetical protein
MNIIQYSLFFAERINSNIETIISIEIETAIPRGPVKTKMIFGNSILIPNSKKNIKMAMQIIVKYMHAFALISNTFNIFAILFIPLKFD